MIEGKEQISATLDKSTVKHILRLKEKGLFNGISDYLQKASDYFEKNRGVNRKDVLIFIVYPWIISAIFYIWSQEKEYDLTRHIVIFYINFVIFGLVIAAVYWLFQKHKRENMG